MTLDYSNQFDIGERRFNYARFGAGAPLILLHGAGGSQMWEDEARRLAKRFDVLIPRHPGFDGAPRPEWLEHVEDLAYLYLEAIESLELDRPILMGHSLGGWTAAEMAIRHPSQFRSMLLISAGGLRVT